MNRLFLRFTVMLLGAVLMSTSGCGHTRPAKFYTLNSLDVSSSQSRFETSVQGLAVGVGPISFPDYLDRPQIITRESRNKLKYSEFHRWAGPLKKNFARNLTENLSILLTTDRMAIFPWKSSTPIDYRVTVNVIRFEGQTGGDVTLSARWSILDSAGKEVLLMKKSTFTEPAGGKTYEALVAAQSRALEGLSREIAEAINTLIQ